jgi:hypothetical protein
MRIPTRLTCRAAFLSVVIVERFIPRFKSTSDGFARVTKSKLTVLQPGRNSSK